MLGHVRLETTTIYTKVARLGSERMVSPLDQLESGKQDPMLENSSPQNFKTQRSTPQRNSVGSIRFAITTEEDGSLTGEVKIVGYDVVLKGVTASEYSNGWIQIELPPLEDWASELKGLPAHVRERIEDQSFFELIRTHLSAHFSKRIRAESASKAAA
jgi:hypothetical protein